MGSEQLALCNVLSFFGLLMHVVRTLALSSALNVHGLTKAAWSEQQALSAALNVHGLAKATVSGQLAALHINCRHFQLL